MNLCARPTIPASEDPERTQIGSLVEVRHGIGCWEIPVVL